MSDEDVKLLKKLLFDSDRVVVTDYFALIEVLKIQYHTGQMTHLQVKQELETRRDHIEFNIDQITHLNDPDLYPATANTRLHISIKEAINRKIERIDNNEYPFSTR